MSPQTTLKVPTGHCERLLVPEYACIVSFYPQNNPKYRRDCSLEWMRKGSPRAATPRLGSRSRWQRPGAGGRAVTSGCLRTWSISPIPPFQGNHCQMLTLSSGRGGFVGPASPSRGRPAHEAWRWLLLSAQHRGLPKPWLPATTSAWWRSGWGPESRFIVSPAPWAPSQAQNWSDDKDKCAWLRARA